MKTVLITGGSRGIGRACAELFAANGYNVAFTYKNSENDAKNLAESINALAIRADSEVESDVIGAVKATLSEYGKIDCLINNAGISSFSLFTDLTLDEWQKTINVNLTGAFLYSRETVRSMISRKKGKIINITSMWGLVGSSCEVHYSASKAGLIGLTKALAKELGPSGITVNAIAPGVIDTDMNRSLSDEDIKALEGETPLMRIGRAEEVARCALYLAGDAADFITGEVINLSGGLVIT
jgi:3-oxoacyl-[acyl-carrier protein] reductase